MTGSRVFGSRGYRPLVLAALPAFSALLLLAGAAAPPQSEKPVKTAGQVHQFVLFDEAFAYSKKDADNSKPSQSHYYIKGSALRQNRPRDWTSPVDYRNGTVHIRIEVFQRPDSGEPTQWSLCYIPNKGQGNGYGCTNTDPYTSTGVYEKDVSMTSFWENNAIIWTDGIKQMDLVMKDKDGNKVHTRPDPEKFFPTRVRITMIQVAAGFKYDPSLVPGTAPAVPSASVAAPNKPK